MALEWVRDNIIAFGGKIDGQRADRTLIPLWLISTGDPGNIQLTGLSAGGSYLLGIDQNYLSSFEILGAHSVHQLLHHASRLPPGVKAPFTSAVLQSNAIM
jgi:hypothetical protein